MTVRQYAHQSLAGSGFAVMSSEIAWQLRPDLWASAQDCGFGFNPRLEIAGTQRMTVRLAGMDKPILVLTRSADQLAQRIEWVTGYKVESLEAESIPKPAPATPIITERQRIGNERRARLQELAAMEPPAHDCHQRREILAAQKEVGLTQ